MVLLIGAGICAIALFVWSVIGWVRERSAVARRHDLRTKRMAKQKAWDVVFGRRSQRRLSFDASERRED